MAFIQFQQNFLFMSIFLLLQIKGFTFGIESSFTSQYLTGNQNCEPYTCKDPDQKFVDNTCLYFNTKFGMWLANPCSESSKFCKQYPNEGHGNFTCQTYYPFSVSYPGEYCENISSCISAYSSACSNHICKALYSLGDTCQHTTQCEPGTYCYVPAQATQGTCQTQIPIDGECTTYKLCANNAICNYTSTINDIMVGTCKPYGSFSDHASVSTCSFPDGINTFGYSDLCSSGYCAPSGEAFYCLESVTSSQELPVLCNGDPINMINATTGCKSTPDSLLGVSVISPCNCANDYNANSYCNLFSGDPIMANFRKYLTKWAQSDGILKCSVVGKYDPLCVKSHWDKDNAEAYIYYYYAAFSYPEIVKTDECVISTINYGYQMARKAYNDDFASLLGISYLVMMVLY